MKFKARKNSWKKQGFWPTKKIGVLRLILRFGEIEEIDQGLADQVLKADQVSGQVINRCAQQVMRGFVFDREINSVRFLGAYAELGKAISKLQELATKEVDQKKVEIIDVCIKITSDRVRQLVLAGDMISGLPEQPIINGSVLVH